MDFEFKSSYDISEVEDAIWAFYDAYDAFYTAYNLSYIRYCADLTDLYWEAEYTYCEENTVQADAGLEELFRSLARSPIRQTLESDDYFGPGYFDAYEGESLYDETFMGLLDREAALLAEYYDLSAGVAEEDYYTAQYFDKYEPLLGENLAELVKVRQEMAAYAGYESYPAFAYDFYYYRNYSPAQASALGEEILRQLVPLYRDLGDSSLWELGEAYCTVEDAIRYVRDACEAMGGVIWEAFRLMEQEQLFDMRAGENRYDISFETYLYTHYVPFVFVNPWETAYDKLTLAHEFGHFANDYVCGGSYTGVDVSEVFSQGMEYVSLCYNPDMGLETAKLLDCLSLYVEQTAYAMFEQALYGMPPEDLNADSIHALYEQICTAYGFDSWNWDSRDYITVSHFYMEPMYIISYVVSNDVAFQIYQLEKAQPGAGKTLLEENLSSTESYIIAFAEDVGLESPFGEDRVRSVREFLEKHLKAA